MALCKWLSQLEQTLKESSREEKKKKRNIYVLIGKSLKTRSAKKKKNKKKKLDKNLNDFSIRVRNFFYLVLLVGPRRDHCILMY